MIRARMTCRPCPASEKNRGEISTPRGCEGGASGAGGGKTALGLDGAETGVAAVLAGSGADGSHGTTRTDHRVGEERLDFTSVAITPFSSGASCGGVMFSAAREMDVEKNPRVASSMARA